MILSFIRGLLGGRPTAAASELRPAVPQPTSPQPISPLMGVSRAGKPRPKRRRPLSLRDAGLGSAAQRRALRSLEIRTTADLLAADPLEIAQRLGLSAGAAGVMRRWQRAIRLSRLLPAMTPREALLLHAVHRKTLRSIAEESAPRLRRDLGRYALSTAGSRLLADQPLPSPERVKGWVEAARRRVKVGS